MGQWKRQEPAWLWVDQGSQGTSVFPALMAFLLSGHSKQQIPPTSMELLMAPNYTHSTCGGFPPRKTFLSRGLGTLSTQGMSQPNGACEGGGEAGAS